MIQAENKAQKISLVQNFPIPNTKEDIFEFMILASSNFDTDFSDIGGLRKEETEAWLAKIEQSYQKAKLLFGDDKEFNKIQNLYNHTYSKVKASTQNVKRNSAIDLALRTICLWLGLIIFVVAFWIDVFSYSNTSIYHLGGGAVMIIGALMIGRKSKDLLDVGIGVLCGVLAILFGTLLQEVFYRNGSMMELAGRATIIIVVVRLVKSSIKK